MAKSLFQRGGHIIKVIPVVVIAILVLGPGLIFVSSDVDASEGANTEYDVDWDLFEYDGSELKLTKNVYTTGTLPNGTNFNSITIVLTVFTGDFTGTMHSVYYMNSSIVFDEITYLRSMDGKCQLMVEDDWADFPDPNVVQTRVVWMLLPAIVAIAPFLVDAIVVTVVAGFVKITLSELIRQLDDGEVSHREESLPGNIVIIYLDDMPAMMHYNGEAAPLQAFDNETILKLETRKYYPVIINEDDAVISPMGLDKKTASLIMALNSPYYHTWTAYVLDAEEIAIEIFRSGWTTGHLWIPFDCTSQIFWRHFHGSDDELGGDSNSMAFYGLINGALIEGDPGSEWYEMII